MIFMKAEELHDTLPEAGLIMLRFELDVDVNNLADETEVAIDETDFLRYQNADDLQFA